MIEVLLAPDHVAAYRLGGTLTQEDVEQVIADVERRLARHERIGIVADLMGFHDLGFRAALENLRYALGRIFGWRRFPREAVITDRQWIRTMVGVAGPLVPFVALRAFRPQESDAALAWAADIVPQAR